MAEERRMEEKHSLCANNCGYFGSSATLNLCSKCFRDYQIGNSHATSATLALQSSSSKPTPIAASEPSADGTVPSGSTMKEEGASMGRVTSLGSRCSVCRKKVGLTGFRCRCGPTFCGVHRYPEQHACGFDFKGEGREAIERANPVVKADKLGRKI